MSEPRVVADPAELAALFERHRGCHLYGLGDLAEPLWSGATWWRRGDAVVGVVPLPASDEVAFYAISPAAPAATTALLVELHDRVPAGAVGSGEIGVVAALRPHRALDDLGTRVKMVVDEATLQVPPTPAAVRVERLGPEDAPALAMLHASDPGAAFHVPSMLDGGHHLGIRDEDGTLLAVAGTHVLDRGRRVAAIGGVLTRPAARGGGLAGLLTGRLAAALLADGLTVGLNVGEDNPAARRVYERLGFRVVHRYEEARLR